MIVRRKGGLTEFIPTPQEKRDGLIRDHALGLLENLHQRLARLERASKLPAAEAEAFTALLARMRADESRIAELEAEGFAMSARMESALHEAEVAKAKLARVKAESLRVVKVGDECEISHIPICGLFSYLGVVYRLYSFSPDEFGAWQVSDHSEHIFAPHTFVQPVRLERWEAVE